MFSFQKFTWRKLALTGALLFALPGVAQASALYDGTAGLNAGTIPFPYKSFVAGHVTVVPDPLGGPNKVMKYAVDDSDRPYAGATNPRADFETCYSNTLACTATNGGFALGADVFYSIKFLIPNGFPTINTSGWYQIAEIYGPPYGTSPQTEIDLRPGTGSHPRLDIHRYSPSPSIPWTSTYPLDTDHTTGALLPPTWHTVTMEMKMEPDNTGFERLWLDGARQTFTNGSQTLNMPTLLSGTNWNGTNSNTLNVNSYRKAGAYPGTVTMYQAAAKVGSTLADVADASAPPAPPTLAAAFTNPATSTTGQTVNFDASSTTGSPVSYAWSDGANALGTGNKLAFTFHYVGTKHVKLTVTDANGAKSSAEHDVVVS